MTFWQISFLLFSAFVTGLCFGYVIERVNRWW